MMKTLSLQTIKLLIFTLLIFIFYACHSAQKTSSYEERADKMIGNTNTDEGAYMDMPSAEKEVYSEVRSMKKKDMSFSSESPDISQQNTENYQNITENHFIANKIISLE